MKENMGLRPIKVCHYVKIAKAGAETFSIQEIPLNLKLFKSCTVSADTSALNKSKPCCSQVKTPLQDIHCIRVMLRSCT